MNGEDFSYEYWLSIALFGKITIYLNIDKIYRKIDTISLYLNMDLIVKAETERSTLQLTF